MARNGHHWTMWFLLALMFVAPVSSAPASAPQRQPPSKLPTAKAPVSPASSPLSKSPTARAPTSSSSKSPIAPAPALSPSSSAKPPSPGEAPSPVPTRGSSTNGTLDPSQVKALAALGVSVGLDPCNTASQRQFICDQSTPYRKLTYLELQYCAENAVFPSSAWDNLTSLRSLTFSECPAKLMRLPAQLVSSLTSLTVIASLGRSLENVLAPGLPLVWLSAFHNLVELNVQDVDVNVTSLSSITSNMIRLQQISFVNTNLTGSLPEKWPPNLTSLEVSGNDLKGGIPSSVGELLQLTSLDLSSCNLSGSIPASLGNLSALETLKLGFNGLTGPIPAAFKKLSALTYLDLSDNQLNGSVPLFLSRLPALRYIDLSKNSFRGELPFNDAFLQSLNTFKVSGNSDLCYNSSSINAKYVAGLQPCDSSGLPELSPSSLSPSLAPAPQPPVQETSQKGGLKRIVLIVAIALACLVFIIAVAVVLSKCCPKKV